MSKRHNRKRTRSRPRHRDTAKSQPPNHTRTFSLDNNTNHTYPTPIPSIPASYFLPPPLSIESWKQQQQHQQPYFLLNPLSYYNHHRHLEHFKAQRERDQMLELRADSLRFFGPHTNDDEVSLIEPMLKVVKDLFDGDIDYEDP